jgi:sister chromatid cohesion protein DCC1
MHLVSLAQPHDAASVLELSRSLEFEHEVRRDVTLQVMRWFGDVDDADERWKMDIEKVVRQIGLGILHQHKVRIRRKQHFFSRPHSSLSSRMIQYLRMSSRQNGIPP